MIEGIDFSVGRLSGPQLEAEGIGFVCRYVSTPGNPKNLTLDEIELYQSLGFGIVIVFERTADAALQGRVRGRSDATSADSQVRSLGLVGAPIYFAVDFDASDTDLVAVGAYLEGVSEVIGLERVGVYGSHRVVAHALDESLATYSWQTKAWSGGRRESRANLFQYVVNTTIGAVAVDRNRTVADDEDYGQVPAPPLANLPVVLTIDPTEGPSEGGTEVVISGTDLTDVVAAWFGFVRTDALWSLSEGEIGVTSPPADASGTVDVVVETTRGFSAPSGAALFTYSEDAPVPEW